MGTRTRAQKDDIELEYAKDYRTHLSTILGKLFSLLLSSPFWFNISSGAVNTTLTLLLSRFKLATSSLRRSQTSMVDKVKSLGSDRIRL